MKHILKITRKEIDLGIGGNCRECPAALALTRDFPGMAPFYAGPTDILFGEAGMQFSRTPGRLAEFMIDFDSFKAGYPGKWSPEPMNVELDLLPIAADYAAQWLAQNINRQ